MGQSYGEDGKEKLIDLSHLGCKFLVGVKYILSNTLTLGSAFFVTFEIGKLSI